MLVYHLVLKATLFTDRTTETVIVKNTQGTGATSVSRRVSAMTEFINMITSDTSSALSTKITPYTTQDVSRTTSENANNDISSVMTETSTQTTTGIANIDTKLPVW